jgi:hypothetical protein
LIRLLEADDPAAAEAREALARRHAERARRPRKRAKPATAAQPRSYTHEEPTRSPVLNAFLHELGAQGIVSVDVTVLREHQLAPRLVEIARGFLGRQLLLAGKPEAALAVAARLKPVVNEAGARLLLRQAAHDQSRLGEIARDYDEYHAGQGRPEQDDRLASCMMAAFAGRWIAAAEATLGEHVRAEVRRALAEILDEGDAGARRRKPSARRAGGEARETCETSAKREEERAPQAGTSRASRRQGRT